MLSHNPDTSLQLLELIGRGANVGLWSWELASGTLRWSARTGALFGVSDPNYAISLEDLDHRLHPDDRTSVHEAFAAHFACPGTLSIDYRMRHENGSYLSVRTRAECLRDDEGTVLYTAGSIEDISERVALDADLRDSRAFLRLMMDINPDPLFVKNRDFVILDANPAFTHMYPESERGNVIGFTTLEGYDPEEAAEFLAMDEKAFIEGHSETTETITFPDGVTRVLETRKTRFENKQGTRFILGSARDVTDREALITRLTNSNHELERFAYVCSHDLQEPLRMVASFSERLEHSLGPQLVDNAKALKDLQYLRDGATRAQQLIREVLAYSSASGNAGRLDPVDLNNVLTALASRREMGNAEQIDGATLEFAEDLPTVMGNETQLFQLLTNLVENGIKYRADNRPPVIKVKARDAGSMWDIEVSDNGIGIETRYFDRIFEVFRRLHRADQYPGTGIGLAMCKKIVENHGGKIWLTSEPGQGSQFVFSLPKIKDQ